ncbi:MAG: ABC transporter ATP-binding protein [Thermoprotei archaeon]|nr:ABC transporter ATP-binding protein [Thermoprotei archaeon]
MIGIYDLEVVRGSFRLKISRLEIKDNEYFVVLGPSGSGKTTLLNTIAGFIRPVKGSIFIDGINVAGLPPEKRGLSYVFQDPLLLPHLSAFGNILLGSHGNVDTALKIAKQLGLDDLLEKYPSQLSRGQQQKVALARALAYNPKALLLDEPLSSLDRVSKEAMIDVLLRLKGKKTVIHVTHDLTEAFMLADRLAIICKGRVLAEGTPDEILHNPPNEKVAKFLGLTNFFKGKARVVGKDKSVVKIDDDVIIHVYGEYRGDVFLTISPSDIFVAKTLDSVTAANKFEGVIAKIVPRGVVDEIRVKVGSSTTFSVYLSKKAVKDLGLKVGNRVVIAFKKSAVIVNKI